MTMWTFLALAAVFVVGLPAIAGIISEYKLKKLQTKGNSEDIEALRSEIKKLKKRLENVEAIAAGDPDGFEKNSGFNDPEYSDLKSSDTHAQEIENILKRKRNR